jgi:hypothetical protein
MRDAETRCDLTTPRDHRSRAASAENLWGTGVAKKRLLSLAFLWVFLEEE